ncbi:hypothetical protein [Methanobrevibacter sp.]
MTEIDWFKFENKDKDFPFYNKNPYIPKWGWIVLLIALIIGLTLSLSFNIIYVILSCIVLIVPVLYFLKWDYKAIFQKPSFKDILLAIGLFIGYIIYALILGIILQNMGLNGAKLTPDTVSIMTFVSLAFKLMSEEFVKFIPFMFFMRTFFKYTSNRKFSIIISMPIVMVFFAFLHSANLITFLFALCVQGVGSIFEFIGYIKTKNILVSYITHLCTDVFIFLMPLLGF